MDCADESDEKDCHFMDEFNGVKEVNPRDSDGDALPIKIRVEINAFPSIDTAKLKFIADFTLGLHWSDHRVTYKNLNEDKMMNGLSLQFTGHNLWTPKLTFANALGNFQTVTDEHAELFVEKIGPADPNSHKFANEAYSYSGKNGRIILKRKYYTDFSCIFELRYYPFDTQICRMKFEIKSKRIDQLKLTEGRVDYIGPKDLVEYEILSTKLDVGITAANRSEATVKILFRRRMEYHVANTFCQTFIMFGVGLLSLFFDVRNFTDRMMVTLTTSLVLATIAASIQADLPKTSYYKLIDWWLLFCSSALVIMMGFHTYLAKICSEIDGNVNKIFSKPTTATTTAKRIRSSVFRPVKINNMAKVFFFLLILAFKSVFWTVALKEYFKTAEEY